LFFDSLNLSAAAFFAARMRVLNLTLLSFATLLCGKSAFGHLEQKIELKELGMRGRRRRTLCPYVLLASFEALSPAPLAFELRYLTPCLDGCQISGEASWAGDGIT
jgi:hypothetical protein